MMRWYIYHGTELHLQYVALQYTSKSTIVLLWCTSKQCLNHGMFWNFLVCLFSFYYIHCSHKKYHGITLSFGHVLWKYYGILTLIYNVNSMLYEYDHAVSWCIWNCHSITIVHFQKSMVYQKIYHVNTVQFFLDICFVNTVVFCEVPWTTLQYHIL